MCCVWQLTLHNKQWQQGSAYSCKLMSMPSMMCMLTTMCTLSVTTGSAQQALASSKCPNFSPAGNSLRQPAPVQPASQQQQVPLDCHADCCRSQPAPDLECGPPAANPLHQNTKHQQAQTNNMQCKDTQPLEKHPSNLLVYVCKDT